MMSAEMLWTLPGLNEYLRSGQTHRRDVVGLDGVLRAVSAHAAVRVVLVAERGGVLSRDARGERIGDADGRVVLGVRDDDRSADALLVDDGAEEPFCLPSSPNPPDSPLCEKAACSRLTDTPFGVRRQSVRSGRHEPPAEAVSHEMNPDVGLRRRERA